jgi:hypothetical protein
VNKSTINVLLTLSDGYSTIPKQQRQATVVAQFGDVMAQLGNLVAQSGMCWLSKLMCWLNWGIW